MVPVFHLCLNVLTTLSVIVYIKKLWGITERTDPQESSLQFHRDEEMAEQRNESVIFKSWFADCYIEMTFAIRYMYMQYHPLLVSVFH
jgi:hypothetical protein